MKLFDLLNASPTPFHATEVLARALLDAGFVETAEAAAWDFPAGHRGFFRRGGSAVAAFVVGSEAGSGFKLAAAHTDSPGWKLKLAGQKLQLSGVVRIGTEVYGSPIHSTWFDRPLAIAGRVFFREGDQVVARLVRTPAVAVFPNLAIHYNREINKGLAYDLQDHLSLLAALDAPDVQTYFARLAGLSPEAVVSADLFAVDGEPAVALGGVPPGGLFLSPRIDNLTGCHAVLGALTEVRAPSEQTRVGLFFDQEEIGSSTWTGADSSLLGDLLERLTLAQGGGREDVFRAKANSFLLSVDAAHGVHPNWAGQHDPHYAPELGNGPVLKASARFSYATTGASEAVVRELARAAKVNLQTYIMKSTLTPGSTVGPITTSWTGIAGADVGIPIWAMHSARETAHTADQDGMIALISQLFRA